jgi:purine-binding chemotaxis protein CheW
MHFLTERGLTLTRLPSVSATDAPADTPLLIFCLGEAQYSLPVHSLRAIRTLGTYTPLPFTPAWMVGVIHLSGQLLSVLDIRPPTNPAPLAPHPDSPLLIVRLDGIEVGLVIDSLVAVPHCV